MEKKTAFSINSAGTEHPQAKRMNLDRFTPFFHKNQLKQVISLNVKCKVITVLEDKTKEILDDFGYGDDFLKKNTKDAIHKRNNNPNFMLKLKNFRFIKHTVKKVERQTTSWE